MTSLDYAKLISWLGWHRHGVIFNKTQVQKLLFICFGVELAMGREIFNDDTPRLFPFGPVFPISYRRSVTGFIPVLSEEEKTEFASEPLTLKNISGLVARFCHVSATQFTRWSHQHGTPWHRTLSEQEHLEWGAEIKREYVKDYFTSPKWSIGL